MLSFVCDSIISKISSLHRIISYNLSIITYLATTTFFRWFIRHLIGVQKEPNNMVILTIGNIGNVSLMKKKKKFKINFLKMAV